MEIQSIEPYKFYSDQSIILLKKALSNLQQQYYEQVKKEEDQKKKNYYFRNNHQLVSSRIGMSTESNNAESYYSEHDDVSDRSNRSDLSDAEQDDDDDDDDAAAANANANANANADSNTQCNNVMQDNDHDTIGMNKNHIDASMNNNHNLKQQKTNKKKKSIQEYMIQMGTPPSETLITDVQHDTNTAYALSIPNVLFPLSSSRDNSDLAHFYQSQEEALNNQDHLEPILSLYRLANDLAGSTNNSSGSSSNSHKSTNVLVILLHSGRFAAAIFNKNTCIKHTTSNRYTVRKGQGGSQSTNDNAKGKAKSVGSQLRRAGETQLRNDVYTTLVSWKSEIQRCSLFFLSISKMLQKGFWQDVDKVFNGNNHNHQSSNTDMKMGFRKGSDQVKSIPLDVGRPCFESCCAVYDLLMTCSLLSVNLSLKEDYEIYNKSDDNNNMMIMQGQSEMQTSLYPIEEDKKRNDNCNDHNKSLIQRQMEVDVIVPLTPLHIAARDGNIEELSSLLSSCHGTHDDIDAIAGPKFMTPLHYAVLSSTNSTTAPNDNNNVNDNRDCNNVDHSTAAKCVTILLTQGHANPCIPDSHHRPPYFLATNDIIRNAFRKARSELGEEMWNWTDGAKVGPALTDDDIKNKREKAAEKKRKQRLRQKEKKALEQQKAAEKERLAREEEEKKQSEENARRVRAGLKPKAASDQGLVCDFCQKDCKGKRKSQLFSRLDFLYCSSDCMKRHSRELMAAAATARMKGT